jgi:sulfur carrier protein
MKILLNGDTTELPRPMSVEQLLAHLDVDPRLVAVEHNRVVVKRAVFSTTMIDEGAEVEIVAFVGGGALFA